MLKTYYLENDNIRLGILNKGCAITEITLKDLSLNTVLAYDELETFMKDPFTMNALVGNHAGRIKDACYKHNGLEIKLQANDGNNHLHGGDQGLSHLYFDIIEEKDCLLARLNHLDVTYQITYCLKGMQVEIEMLVIPKQETLLNLTQHTYFNLSNEKSIQNHYLTINANKVQALDETGVPSKNTIAVGETVFDFQRRKKIKEAIQGTHQQFAISKNIDHPYHTNYLVLESPDESISMTVESDAPVMVVYLANYFNDGVTRLKNRGLACDHEAIAVEPQYLPNDVNLKQGPSQFFSEEKPFKRKITYTYTLKKD